MGFQMAIPSLKNSTKTLDNIIGTSSTTATLGPPVPELKITNPAPDVALNVKNLRVLRNMI